MAPVQWGVLNKDCGGGASETKVYYAKEGPGVKGVEFNIAPSARRVSKTIHPAVVWPMGRFPFPPASRAADGSVSTGSEHPTSARLPPVYRDSVERPGTSAPFRAR